MLSRILMSLMVAVLMNLGGCASPKISYDIPTPEAAGPTIVPASPKAIGARRGHAHNDYVHPRPLVEALELGYGSIEADVFLVDGELLVGHDQGDLRPGRTLRAMYLDPLVEYAKVHEEKRKRGADAPLILLVDIKADGLAVYRALHEMLEQRFSIFTELRNGVVIPRAVTVILSGDSPREELKAQTQRWAFVDGHESDLLCESAAAVPVSLVPLVSMSWPSQFKWNGQGEMPEVERRKLEGLVAAAHARGYLIRFWGAPAISNAWDVQWDAGADLIGMDDLSRGASYFRNAHTQLAR
jgi:hypothetical protein